MACVDFGKLRAYCDGELGSAEVAKMARHIDQCPTCKTRLDDVRQTGLLVSAKLSAVAAEPPPSVEASVATLRRNLALQDNRRGLFGWLASLLAGADLQWRALAAGMATIAIVAAVIALPPVRSAADDLLGIFRVQKFTPVSVDPLSLSNLPMLDPRMMGTLDGPTPFPKIHSPLSPAEVAAQVDFTPRWPQQLPAGLAKEPRLGVMDAFSGGYTFDAAKAEAYLASMGIQGITLPKTLSGRKISAIVPTRLVAEYASDGGTAPGLGLFEGKSPSIEIPDGVDTEEVRNAVLSVPGLPPELVVQLQALDWKTTAPVPVIKGSSSKQLIVDGVEGLLVQDDAHKMNVLLWQKDGLVYVLVGEASGADLVNTANSFK